MAKKKTEKVSTKQPVRKDINPQLCKVYNPEKHDWSHAWVAEPKFDGLRCIVVVEEDGAHPYSRNGRPLWHLDNILTEAAAKCPIGTVLDGEVYTTDWNQSMSIVKRSKSDHIDKDKIRYHVWDFLYEAELHATWTDGFGKKHLGFSRVSNQGRKERVFSYFSSVELPGNYISGVSGKYVHNDIEFQQAYNDFLEAGFEGVVLKDPASPYEGGRRSPHWRKHKPWSDADLTVVGAYPGEGKHIGRIGGLVLEGQCEWKDKEYQIHTEVGTGFTDEEREFFQGLADSGQLAGRVVEVKFQDVTVDGAMRFPVYHRLRSDK